MKKILEYLIIIGFVLFFFGGLILVCTQIAGLFFLISHWLLPPEAIFLGSFH